LKSQKQEFFFLAKSKVPCHSFEISQINSHSIHDFKRKKEELIAHLFSNEFNSSIHKKIIIIKEKHQIVNLLYLSLGFKPLLTYLIFDSHEGA
jgi:hypothetical protein